VDLDNIWKWLGFKYKSKAKYLLENNFELEKDYKKSLTHAGKQKIIEINSKDNFATAAAVAKTKGSGGQNIQKYSKIFKNII